MLCLVLFSVGSRQSAAGLTGRDYAVELTATVNADPPEIQLLWPGDQYARKYTVNRKLRDEKTWTPIGTADGPDAGFSDRSLAIGHAYEYQVIKESSFGQTAYGYIYSGIQVPLVEDRGRIIVLVDASLVTPLSGELDRLEYDLIGDGWSVARAIVSRTNAVTDVKALIKSIYAQDPIRTRALLLFGHIPVPYSGDIMPDGHPNHQGAWPADVYYADVDGTWTDDTVDSTGAEQARNHNVPGDGKFDQSTVPSAVELETGRVDFANLTCFLNKTPPRTEIDLARGYLDKDHKFRQGEVTVEPRALVYDRIESITAEPIAAAAWRNFVPFVRSENVQLINWGEYIPDVSTGSYLWSAVCAGGAYVSADGIGSSDMFALYDVNVAFTTFIGSYYGDWDVESAFLRAAIGANGTILTAAYSGQPEWLFHPMALGEPIGYSAKITQENATNGVYLPHNDGAGEVHVALLGDPTLRAFVVPPPRNLAARWDRSIVTLSWDKPEVGNLVGFNVYRAAAPKGPYQKINVDPTTATQISIPDSSPTDCFMVKAVALTVTPSGSYYNGSEGALYPDQLSSLLATAAPTAPAELTMARVTQQSITLAWLGTSAGATSYRIERKGPLDASFQEIGNVSGSTLTYEDEGLAVPGRYTYRARAFNSAGPSAYSNEASATTLSGSAEFAGADTVTLGNWLGRFGEEAFIIPGVTDSLPSFISLSVSNVSLYRPAFATDPRAPELPSGTLRSANAWISGSHSGFHFNASDDQVHQFAIYLMTAGGEKMSLHFDVYDEVSGALLDHQAFDDVSAGIYVVYNLRRQIYVQIAMPDRQTYAQIYGVFLDPARIAPLAIQPSSGGFFGKTNIVISTATPGAEVHFTTDGTLPTRQSQRYDGPFPIYSDIDIQAAAFKDGYPPTLVSEAKLQNALQNVELFLKWDEETSGNWITQYGHEGYWLPRGGKALPGYAEMDLNNIQDWSWFDGSNDSRAAFIDASGSQRNASAWYADDVFDLNLSVFDSKPHSIALYFLDWDGGNRTQDIWIFDSSETLTGHYLMQDFANGSYLILAQQGRTHIKITKDQGPNVVLNGIFFDPLPASLLAPKAVPLTRLTLANGSMQFSIDAFPGQWICSDRSTDLTHWECYATNEVTSTSVNFSFPVGANSPKRFFRTHFLP
ncbi:MAG TPA: chitobiase/beta-hexosaminidase C-terminal domain-containing protein [Verrucomicrobiae bacterium]|nr:chitobiase/beta-hexosaminidase C-terminal domain-containing protein [Verrucomicrobiae bacterium]